MEENKPPYDRNERHAKNQDHDNKAFSSEHNSPEKQLVHRRPMEVLRRGS